VIDKQVPARVIFIFLERPAGTNGFFSMQPSAQYRKFADDCRRFAQIAKTDEQRKVLEEMEVVWTKLAEETEQEQAKSGVS
jgi:hypothetical protein